jgi:phosphohistidine phosphatase
MKLYFLRHAGALAGADDAARPLSAHGQKQAAEIGRFLKRAGVEFDVAYTSPLVRAKQTAEIVLKVCGSTRLQISDALLNETSQTEFDEWLSRLPSAKHLLLVGHAPSLPERVRHLLGVTDAEAFKLPKAGLACLDTGDRRIASLKFFITPKALGLKADG